MDDLRSLCISTAMAIRSGWARLSVTRSRIGKSLVRGTLAGKVRGSDASELLNSFFFVLVVLTYQRVDCHQVSIEEIESGNKLGLSLDRR